jgi:hypothetical protein
MIMEYNTPEKAAERVAIAKDALAWIEAGALIPTHGVYVVPTRYPKYGEDNDKQLRDVDLGECRVCAMGAILLAKAVRFDNLLAKNLSSGRTKALLEHFEPNQLKLIEYTFEGWNDMAMPLGEAVGQAIFRFCLKHLDTKERLIAILNNIIEHNGTFSI